MLNRCGDSLIFLKNVKKCDKVTELFVLFLYFMPTFNREQATDTNLSGKESGLSAEGNICMRAIRSVPDVSAPKAQSNLECNSLT